MAKKTLADVIADLPAKPSGAIPVHAFAVGTTTNTGFVVLHIPDRGTFAFSPDAARKVVKDFQIELKRLRDRAKPPRPMHQN